MEKLDMDNEKKGPKPESADAETNSEESTKEAVTERPTGGLEGFYENFRSVPLKYLDAFIIICFLMLIAIIAFGVWRARV